MEGGGLAQEGQLGRAENVRRTVGSRRAEWEPRARVTGWRPGPGQWQDLERWEGNLLWRKPCASPMLRLGVWGSTGDGEGLRTTPGL